MLPLIPLPALQVKDQEVSLSLQKVVTTVQSIFRFLTYNEGWKQPSLAVTVAYFGSPFPTPAYRRDMFSRVTVKGSIKSTAGVAALTTMFTLPVGYRPKETLILPAEYGGTYKNLYIDANGNVAPGTAIAAGQAITFYVEFYAEQ